MTMQFAGAVLQGSDRRSEGWMSHFEIRWTNFHLFQTPESVSISFTDQPSLQFDEGPSRLRFMVLAVRRNFCDRGRSRGKFFES